MPLLRRLSIFLCTFGFCCASSLAQKRGGDFPTNDEIRLVLTQADRAVQEYKPLLDLEEQMYGEKGKAAVAKDREVVSGIETAINAFGRNPQAFNSSLGFSFFEWLDDADRNALLCASGAATEATTSMLAGDNGKAQTDINLSQNCKSVATLFYTVSENAGALYTRFVQNEEQVAKEGGEIAKKCAEVLKQNGITPKK